MTHYRALMDHEFLGAWDCQKDGKGVEVTFTIGAVETVEVYDPHGKYTDPETGQHTSKRLCIVPRERPERKLVLNKTNADCVAALHGTDADQWPGKKITIYPAQTSFGKRREDCIRIKLPDELLRNSPVIRSRVRQKLLAELGWHSLQPKSREERTGEK